MNALRSSFSSFAALASLGSAAALAAQTPTSPITLGRCVTDDGVFAMSLTADGGMLLFERDGAIVPTPLVGVSRHSSPDQGWSIVGATGQEILLSTDGAGRLESVWDRNYFGGTCAAGSTFDADALATAAERTRALSRTRWKLATCAQADPGEAPLVITYREGFLPNTVVIEGLLDEGMEEIRFVASGWSSDSAMGKTRTLFTGAGAALYSSAGRHATELETLSVFENHVPGGTSRVQIAVPWLQDDLGTCEFSNLWHIRRLVPGADAQ